LFTIGERELATSDAPLALVFERLTGASSKTMSLIAVMAMLNGIIVQIIMASRVHYSLALQRELVVDPGIEFKTVERDSLSTDGNFSA
jgi:amino acid transporter